MFRRRPARPADFDEALAGAGTGDAAGFQWLFEAYGRRVNAYVRSRGCAEPDDVTSEVFAAAFWSLAGFSGTEDNFVAWLFQIARNKVIDGARYASRRPQLSPGEGGPDEVAGVDVEAAALGDVENAWLWEVLDELTDEQREVLILRFVADLSIERTAEVLGKEANAVKALQHRAIRAAHRKISAGAVTP